MTIRGPPRSNIPKIEDFVFSNELQTKLQSLLDFPHRIPGPLCFYGLPGTGKTTFAIYLAHQLAHHILEFDANAYKGNKLQDFSDSVSRIAGSLNLFEATSESPKKFSRAIIIDEWHNFGPAAQDKFKVSFEKFSKDYRCLFIICANTDRFGRIREVLNPAIYSRCHTIRFDILPHQLEEVVGITMNRFPLLSEQFIRQTLPDFRKIKAEYLLRGGYELEGVKQEGLRNEISRR